MSCNGTAAVVSVPDNFSTQQWKGATDAFLDRCVDEKDKRYTLVRSFLLYPDQCHSGVYWAEWLAGSSGMTFTLLPLPDTTVEDIDRAIHHLHRNRDVVGCVKVDRVKRWISARGMIDDQIKESPKTMSDEMITGGPTADQGE